MRPYLPACVEQFATPRMPEVMWKSLLMILYHIWKAMLLNIAASTE